MLAPDAEQIAVDREASDGDERRVSAGTPLAHGERCAFGVQPGKDAPVKVSDRDVRIETVRERPDHSVPQRIGCQRDGDNQHQRRGDENAHEPDERPDPDAAAAWHGHRFSTTGAMWRQGQWIAPLC